jgi:hypothetical protein
VNYRRSAEDAPSISARAVSLSKTASLTVNT